MSEHVYMWCVCGVCVCACVRADVYHFRLSLELPVSSGCWHHVPEWLIFIVCMMEILTIVSVRMLCLHTLKPISNTKVTSENPVVNIFHTFAFQCADSILIVSTKNLIFHHSCLWGSH